MDFKAKSGTSEVVRSSCRSNVHYKRTAQVVCEHDAVNMPLFTPLRFRFASVMIQTTSLKFFLLIISVSSMIFIFFILLLNKINYFPVNERFLQEAINNIKQDTRYAEVYRKKDHLRKDLKYILLWTPKDYAPFYQLGEGQRAFVVNNCSMINCFITDNRQFFDGDVTKFDAIAFNGRNLDWMSRYELPKNRKSHQKYIYLNMESSDNYPVCSEMFDAFFNWTATYKLNSDIPFPYIQIRNRNGEVVGPKQDMKWEDVPLNDEDFSFMKKKSKAAAWFVSNCSSRSGRKELVQKLQKSLQQYGLSIDIYGNCGPLKCPRNMKKNCDDMLERDYFFYMSLENSFAEDYVTEKLLTAVQHNTVPIVYGGADYSRFLPPGTYLDAFKMSSKDLAATMARLISSPELYIQHFRWKSQYTYLDPSTTDSVCALCAALNNITMMKRKTVYKDFRTWWNPSYRERC